MVQAVKARALIQDSKDNVNVFMQEIASTSGRDEHPVLTTVGVSTCVAVTLYDPESQAGSLAHFSPGSQAKNLRSALKGMLFSLQGAGFRGDNGNLRVHVLGGYEYHPEFQQLVLTALIWLGLPEPVGVEYSTLDGLDIALDTRTGEVLDLRGPFFFRDISEEEKEIKILRAQLPEPYYTNDTRVSSYRVFIAN